MFVIVYYFIVFEQKTAFELRISDWSSDVCSSDLDFEPMKAYSRGQAFQEARQKAASEAHPTAANVAAGAGIVGGLTLPATKIAKGATLFQKAKAGMKTAGAYGALSGAMSSKDETIGRANV